MKLKDIVNVPVQCNYNSGFLSYKTKYNPNATFAVGRLKDKQGSPMDQGNFESAVPQKGVPKAEWGWAERHFDKNKWEESYSWKLEVDGEEKYFDLSFTQDKNLREAIAGQAPCKVKPKFVDLGGGKSTIGFEVLGGIPPIEPVQQIEEPEVEEIDPEDLPF